MLKWGILILVSMPGISAAASIEKAINQEPLHIYKSAKKLFSIERCIVMLDAGDTATVYRTPDRPEESLIYYPKLFGNGQTVIKLELVDGAVVAKLWNTKGLSNKVAECM